jgi:uncharacterized membrane protein
VLYAILLYRLGCIDLARQFRGAHAGTAPLWVDYWRDLVTRGMLFGIPIASLFGAYRLQKQPGPPLRLTVDTVNDIRAGLSENAAFRLFFWVGLFAAFVYLQLELNRMLFCLYAPLRLPLLTGLWAGMCAILAALYLEGRSRAAGALLCLFVAGMLVKLALVDLPHWDVRLDMLRYGAHGAAYSSVAALMRLLDFGLVAALLGLLAWRLGGTAAAPRLGGMFAGLGLIVLFAFLTLEVNTCLGYFAPRFRAGGVSIVWSAFALSLLVAGIKRASRALRLAALALFAVVGWKVFVSDLARLDPLYRIVAFLVIGVLVLAGSFLYLKNRQRFEVAETERDPASDTARGR